MIPILQIIFLVALGLIVYAYVGFPLVTWLASRLVRRPYRCEPITPEIDLIICCHNEQDGIEAKIQNILSLDYPADRLHVYIASDGSTDQTEDIVSRYLSGRLQLLRLPRQGKAKALNAAVGAGRGEILVFSDANSMYAPDALSKLAAPFADQRIGGVAGNQVYRKGKAGLASSGESSYWDFDRLMKTWQSMSGNTISATGAIYAIRRSLFQQVPDGVTDDFVTSTRVIEQGYRLVFEPAAICLEPVAGSAKAEFGRKTRIITRGLRGVLEMKSLLNPFRYGFYSLQMFSHKVLRRLVVFPLIVMGLISPILWNEHWIYRVMTVGEAGLLAAAGIGYMIARTGRKASKVLAIPFFFVMINMAVLVATWNVICGRKITVWNPHREGDAPASGAPASVSMNASSEVPDHELPQEEPVVAATAGSNPNSHE